MSGSRQSLKSRFSWTRRNIVLLWVNRSEKQNCFDLSLLSALRNNPGNNTTHGSARYIKLSMFLPFVNPKTSSNLSSGMREIKLLRNRDVPGHDFQDFEAIVIKNRMKNQFFFIEISLRNIYSRLRFYLLKSKSFISMKILIKNMLISHPNSKI